MTTKKYSDFRMYDGEQNKIENDCWFEIDTDTGAILEIGSGKAPTGSIDLENKFVMPSLINSHTHIALDSTKFDGGANVDQTEATVRALNHLNDLTKSGVTYIRECGSSYALDITLSNLIKKRKINKTTKIMASGRALSITGGHGDHANGAKIVDSPDEVRKAVRENLKDGAEAIKMMTTGGVMSPGDYMEEAQFNLDELNTAVYEVHAKHKIIAAYAEGNPGIMNAITSGFDSIEHGFYVNDEEIDMMLEKGTYLTPTLVAAWGVADTGQGILPEWEISKMRNAIDDAFSNLKNAWKKGVPLTLGTDAGTPFNDFSITPKELELMVEHLNLSSFEALQTSLNSAKLMKIDDRYGSLKKGKQGDFIVVDENPLEDVKSVQQSDKQVFIAGNRVY